MIVKQMGMCLRISFSTSTTQGNEFRKKVANINEGNNLSHFWYRSDGFS